MGSTRYNILKRIIDILGSISLLIILLPLFLLVMAAILVIDGRPIFFKQYRVGLWGNLFKIYKFRSMKKEAPNVASRNIENNEYTTGIGRFLRRTSIDELPQLLNILKGEMSFVGPRPFIPNEGEILKEREKYGIHLLKPGLTGWAQIMARNTNNQKKKIELDLYYLENKSIFLDIKIILLTIFNNRGV
ncbi:sugar transferase [Proteiniclasticum ruminis]|uniref:O-antigen biosynthesis protein WbqP n=1 Tax=Proteiniclasticum ruminis TaxID=398199 RepID=A0A1G8JMZ0_9CLOT|nr:sugar transferase [Proteiniclasticum ruminis]SDI32659.1 O-antigen biosynthesis protein WbqP [Proteiniclasticum ruminis]